MRKDKLYIVCVIEFCHDPSNLHVGYASACRFILHFSVTCFVFQTFDRFRCAELVMECLCSFDDASMNRMSVAICGILAAKVANNVHLYRFPYPTRAVALYEWQVSMCVCSATLLIRYPPNRHLAWAPRKSI